MTRQYHAGITYQAPIIRVLIPQNGTHAHRICNGTYAVIDITEWRTPALGRDAKHLLNGFLSPIKLGDNRLVAEGRHLRVGPRV